MCWREPLSARGVGNNKPTLLLSGVLPLRLRLLYIYSPLSCSAFAELSGSFMTPATKLRRVEIKINWVKLSWLVSTSCWCITSW